MYEAYPNLFVGTIDEMWNFDGTVVDVSRMPDMWANPFVQRNKIDHFCRLIDFGLHNPKGTGKVLVACHQGVSRSPTVVVLYCAHHGIDDRPVVLENYAPSPGLRALADYWLEHYRSKSWELKE